MGFAPVGTNATKPVDVLKVLDYEADRYQHNYNEAGKPLDNLIEARAAVAELIEAAKQYLHAELMQDLIAAEDRLDAALRKVQP